MKSKYKYKLKSKYKNIYKYKFKHRITISAAYWRVAAEGRGNPLMVAFLRDLPFYAFDLLPKMSIMLPQICTFASFAKNQFARVFICRGNALKALVGAT